MGSQSLEILRQGVWASLTGGWFYDPHQSVFCNTFHFYLWMFLLSFPFIIYLYFPPSPIVYCVYCGVIGALFLLIKLTNHSLHRMFDTSECIQESIPDNELHHIQRKRSQTSAAKTSIEEEGIEMQVLKKAVTNPPLGLLNEPTDDEGSVNSGETVTQVASSTIDLKVDVHRKNSSGSSEESRDPLGVTCLQDKKINENSALRNDVPTTPEEDQKKVVDKSLQKGTEDWKRPRPGLIRNLSAELQDVVTVDQASCYDLELTANGSCGVLPQPPMPDREQLKISGSLELPLKDEDHSEKGLLYWKQQHLESKCEKLRKVENIMLLPSDEIPALSEMSINSTSSLTEKYSPTEPSSDTIESTVDVDISHKPQQLSENENDTRHIMNVLENFDWYGEEFSPQRRSKMRSPGASSEFNDGKKQEKKLRQNVSLINQLKISKEKIGDPDVNVEQNFNSSHLTPALSPGTIPVAADSDADSDSSGEESRSPLLCRHDSHHHDKGGGGGEGACYYQEAGAAHLARAGSSTAKQVASVFAEKARQKPAIISGNPPFSVYYEYDDLIGSDDYVRLRGPIPNRDSDESIEPGRSDWASRASRINHSRRESFLLGNKKLSLTSSIEVDTPCNVEESVPTSDPGAAEQGFLTRCGSVRERLRESSPWSLSSALDWLYEHTDSEFESPSRKENSEPPAICSSSALETTITPANPNSGAIPKVNVSQHHHHHHRHRSGRTRRSSDGSETVVRKKKHTCERENDIIDEEDAEMTFQRETRSESLPNDMGPSSSSTGCVIPRPAAASSEWREQYDSSSGSTTELSSLLPLSSLLATFNPPSSPLLAAFLASRTELPAATNMPGIDDGTNATAAAASASASSSNSQTRGGRCYHTMVVNPNGTPTKMRHRKMKRSSRYHRSSRSQPRTIPELSSVVNSNTHIATSFNDTSQGAIHCFQDDRGKWWSYAFDASGTGAVVPLHNVRRRKRAPSGRRIAEAWDSNINLVSNSNSENESSLNVSPRLPRVVMSLQRSSANPSASTNSSSVVLSMGDGNNNADQSLRRFLEQHYDVALTRGRPFAIARTHAENPADMNNEETRNSPMFAFIRQPKRYYKLFYTPWHYTKVRFDRLELIALFDRSLTWFEVVTSVLLSVFVSLCGILLLNYGFYRDLYAFFFCVTMAGCHYSLIKSVQPDASSPTHGYNSIVIYSRSIYFCLASCVILFLSWQIQDINRPEFRLYKIHITSDSILRFLRDGMVSLLLFFPFLFTLGLFPQINTFALHLAEQIDVHVFGGAAIPSLVGAAYCLTRSIVVVVLVFGFAYGALVEVKQSQHILFSIFAALVVTLSYHLSRSSSDPTVLWNILKEEFREKPDRKERDGAEAQPSEGEPGTDEFVDPLPAKLMSTVHARLINDVIVGCFVSLLVFGIHCSSVFNTLQPDLNHILWIICGSSGLLLHYIMPQLRKQLPWLCLSQPVLRSQEYGQFEVREPARVMWFEEVFLILCFLERNVLYPVLVLATVTFDAPQIASKFGIFAGALISSICAIKVMRSAFSNTQHQYLIVVFAALLFEIDYDSYSETFLMDYFFVSILFAKTNEFLLKLQFVVTYIAPWQITWGSAFHAFAQPFSVPHSAMLFIQAILSAILSAPLNPFLGSAIFIVSYVRPIKFWERDYNTKRVDQSNIRLSSHLERNLGADDNNLNSIFYEHLTRSLQHSLCGDLELGRWGPVSQGDCFVLASDYLNCLIHIIEMGNGLVTFQVRGLEFRGTYCQQREVEAISEGVDENEGCCCCEPGHLPNVLSVNAAFSQRWLAWEVTATKYVLEGYSISDNSAVSMLQVFDFRKVLVTYYVKSIIWYCIRSPLLDQWLNSRAIQPTLQMVADRNFVDLDPIFTANIDQDFDFRAEGITRLSFCGVYHDWIQFCATKREKALEKGRNSPLVSLCMALSLMGRRALGTASVSTVSSAEYFLYGLHALFKGDFRITSVRDEWVFSDMELLKRVVAPAVRMSLKLHQDHFRSPDEYEDNVALYDAMADHEAHLVISHEGDPAWRNAVLSGTPSLLALRHALDDGTDDYKVIMLNKRYLSFRVIKLNRECVRGLWAGQQQELVFLRNRNPERGSIQNAKQALRNMINSSCDQPIGYPIYVSPLTTSYADTNSQIVGVVGGAVSLSGLRDAALQLWRRIRARCRQGCSSGATVGGGGSGGDDASPHAHAHYSFGHHDGATGVPGSGGVYAMTNLSINSAYGHNTSGSQSMDSSQFQLCGTNRGGSLGRNSLGGRGSFPSGGKPSSATLVSLAGLLSSAELAKGESLLRERETSFCSVRERQSREECCRKYDENRKSHEDRKEDREKGREKRGEAEEGKEKEAFLRRVRIVDPKQVFDAINLGRRIDVLWPDENMRARGGRSFWKDWLPDTGMEGVVVHKWVPNHRDPSKRSHVDKTILLLRLEQDRYVPIAECGVVDCTIQSTSTLNGHNDADAYHFNNNNAV